MARDGDDRFAKVTPTAAQVGFSQAGDPFPSFDERQVAVLEDLMWDHGALGRPQMAGTFAAIRAEDPIRSQAVRRRFPGKKDLPTDLGVWSGEPTRMPARMYSEYLRGPFLENRLSAGRFAVEGRVVALRNIATPVLVVATEGDRIAPRRTVGKTTLFTDCDLTFVLVEGGHNGGSRASQHPRDAYSTQSNVARGRKMSTLTVGSFGTGHGTASGTARGADRGAT